MHYTRAPECLQLGNYCGKTLTKPTEHLRREQQMEKNEKTLYQRFEQGVTLILAVLISIMVLTALWELIVEIYHLVAHGVFDHVDNSTFNKAFQSVFGVILTLLIALEFSHSIIHPSSRSGGIIKTRTVVLIAILAVSRQFIVFELQADSARVLAALAASLLALGIVYRLIRENQG